MNTAAMFSALVILSILGILCFYAVVLAEKLFCPWYLPAESTSV
jgi:ABC-type nitrate/sulfonate/bicarbonate transport system permease component